MNFNELEKDESRKMKAVELLIKTPMLLKNCNS